MTIRSRKRLKAFGNKKKNITERERAPDTRVGTGGQVSHIEVQKEPPVGTGSADRSREGGDGEKSEGEGQQWVGVEGTDRSNKRTV